MELLLGFVLIAVSTAFGLVGAARISGARRGAQPGNAEPTGRQRLPMLGWRMLHIGLLVFGVLLVRNELGEWAYLIFGVAIVAPLIFALWRNWRRPADA